MGKVLKVPRLKAAAVPSVFQCKVSVPADHLGREKRAGSGEEGNDEEVGKYAEALDVFSNLEDLATKINCDRLPHGFVSRFTEESAAFSLVTVPPGDSSDSRPELAACLVVQKSLAVSLWKNGVRVPEDEFTHLLSNHLPFNHPIVVSVSQVHELLSFLASCEDKVDLGRGESEVGCDTLVLHLK